MPARKHPLFQRVSAPRNVRPVVKILKLGATERKVFLCLSPRPWGFTTHWTKQRRTQPCIAHRGKCQHCAELSPRRDRGYLLAANVDGQVVGFVDLTPEAFLRGLELAEQVGTLRGQPMLLYRSPETLKGAMRLELYPIPVKPGLVLPPDCDPEPSLRRIWGLDNAA